MRAASILFLFSLSCKKFQDLLRISHLESFSLLRPPSFQKSEAATTGKPLHAALKTGLRHTWSMMCSFLETYSRSLLQVPQDLYDYRPKARGIPTNTLRGLLKKHYRDPRILRVVTLEIKKKNWKGLFKVSKKFTFSGYFLEGSTRPLRALWEPHPSSRVRG